jgi:hypothetical protein
MKLIKSNPKRTVERYGDKIEVYDDLTVVNTKQTLPSTKYFLSELNSEDIFTLNNGDYEEIQKLLIVTQMSKH